MGNNTKQDFTELVDQILYKSTGYGKFKVFDYEASSGKTYNYAKAVVDYYHMIVDFGIDFETETCDKSLIVIKTIKEGNEVAKIINKNSQKYQTNTENIAKFALAINSDYKQSNPTIRNMGKDEYVDFLHKFPVLIITQKEYLNICVDWERGKKYYGNRNLLIVDEEIDVVYNSFSVLMLNDITLIEDKYLSGCTEAQNVYRAIVEKLKDYLVKNIRQMQRIEVNHDKKQLNDLIVKFHYKVVEAIDERKFKHLKRYADFKNVNTVEEARSVIVEKVKQIEKFYNNTDVIKYGSYLHTYNPNLKLFTLKNNIWIDASASFNYIYKVSRDTFDLASKSERLIDHSRSKLIFDIVTRSTTSGKNKYIDLEKEVLEHICGNLEDDDKILIMDNKAECERIDIMLKSEQFEPLAIMRDEGKFETVNFQAMRGSNSWAKFNKLYIIQQPQFLLVYYVFLYEYWKKCKLSNNEMFLGNHIDEKVGESVFGFYLPSAKDGNKTIYTQEEKIHSNELELVRYTTQASSIYQGIKRIQRNTSPTGEMVIMLGDKRMRDLIVAQLKNIKVEYTDLKITPKKESPENDVKKLADMVYKMPIGYIADIDIIAKELNTDRAYIHTIINRNPGIKEVMKNRSISIIRLSKITWYLLSQDEETAIPIQILEKQFSIKWENYRKTKEYTTLNYKRKINTKKGNVHIGSVKY